MSLLYHIIPQFCKHFQWGSPNLSKALLHLQLCKYFLNEKFFEMLRKVCGGSNLSTFLALWGIYIKKFRRFESGYGSKNPEMHLQNFEKLQSQKIAPIRFDGLGQEKSLEISVFFRFFVPASKSDTHHVSTGQFRCRFCVSQFRCRAMAHFSLGETGACK